jgi:aldehyde dehydrogenase (NAD+)
LYEYLQADWLAELPASKSSKSVAPSASPSIGGGQELSTIDRTAKLYIGGKQTRPDSGYSYSVKDNKGRVIGQAGMGNRKDVRNAVEAALKASAWSSATAHNRAQVLYFIAENLSARVEEFVKRLTLSGAASRNAKQEVETAIARIFFYAAHADKYDGRIHSTNAKRQTTLAFNEPFGVMGVVCPDENPLLAMISLLMPALAMGNRVVLVASQSQPLIVTDFYQVLDTSDVPGGAVNILTGARDELAKTLAEHDEVASIWYHGSADGSAMVEKASAGNVKSTWVSNGKATNWFNGTQAESHEYLRRATQVKNIWIPYGE